MLNVDNCSPVTIMSHCLHHGSSISSSHTSVTQHTDVSAALSRALLTHGAILKTAHTWENIGASPGRVEWRLDVQTAGRVDGGHLDSHPEPANRATAATLAKCIP